MRAAIYTRISMDRAGKRAGVERQQADCRALCERRGWEIVEVLEDNDKSAFNGKHRPEYERLVKLVTAGDVDVVVAWHSDRLWRSVLEQQAFMAVGQQAGLSLVATPSSDFDPRDADDSFMSTLMAAVAQKESADKSRRMGRKQLDKAERGEHHGGRRAYGHTLDRTALVDDEADAIRAAARRLLDGMPAHAIVREWLDEGRTTTTGRTWTSDTFGALMQQSRLAGLRSHRGQVVAKAGWPAIITEEEHRRLVALFDARRRGPRPTIAKKYLLVGLLRCQKCGTALRANVPTADHTYVRYQCPPKTVTAGACGGTAIIGEATEDVVRELVFAYLDSDEYADAIARVRDAAASSSDTVAALIEQVATDRARLDELGDGYADGLFDRPEYLRLSTRIRVRIEAAERKLARLQVVSQPGADMQGHGANLRRAWSKMTLDEKRTVIQRVADHFEIGPAEQPRNVYRPERVRPVWRFAG